MRFNPAWSVLASKWVTTFADHVIASLRSFRPNAILTVPHNFFWLTAATVARRLKLPLHLIYHDDWPSHITRKRSGPVWNMVRWGCRLELGRVYRQAVSRLCVSPGMEEYCRQVFGVPGQVMYPSRGDDSPPAYLRVRPGSAGPPVIAYCGTLHHSGGIVLLHQLKTIVSDLGGHLDLYCPTSTQELDRLGFRSPVVRRIGFLPAFELADRLAQTAHALFLPASFEYCERVDVSTLFPSKLGDYTAIGLPVLVWGPGYSSAARWAAENPGATVCITDPDPAALKAALNRLVADPLCAISVAIAGVQAGNRYFELTAARKEFFGAISEFKNIQ